MKKHINILLAIVAILVVIISLLWAGAVEFSGTDNRAVEVIEEMDYKPWFSYLIAPSSAVVESFLFSLQAALGAGVLFYIIGYFTGRRKALEKQKNRK